MLLNIKEYNLKVISLVVFMKNHQHRIKSFVIRKPKLSKRQSFGMSHYHAFNPLVHENEKINLEDHFKNNKDLVLDIGFGMGAGLIKQARQCQRYNYLGIEVYPPGVGAILADIKEFSSINVAIINDDAIEILQKNIADNTFIKVQLLYPDPWHKKRHNKRRIISVDFLNEITRVLKHNGVLQIITDWEEYAIDIKRLIDSHNRFQVIDDASSIKEEGLLAEPDNTRYAQKGIEKGHNIFDIVALMQ